MPCACRKASDSVGAGGDGAAPPGQHGGGGGLEGGLVFGGQLRPAGLADHQGAGVVHVLGQHEVFGDFVDLEGDRGGQREVDAGDGALGEAEIDLAAVERHGDGAEGAEHRREHRAGLDAHLQAAHVVGGADGAVADLHLAPAVPAPGEALDAAGLHVGEQALAELAVEQAFRGRLVLEDEGQVDDLDRGHDRLQVAGGEDRAVDDAGGQAVGEVDGAAERAADEHLDVVFAAGALVDLGAETLADFIGGVVGGVGGRQFQHDRGGAGAADEAGGGERADGGAAGDRGSVLQGTFSPRFDSFDPGVVRPAG